MRGRLYNVVVLTSYKCCTHSIIDEIALNDTKPELLLPLYIFEVLIYIDLIY